MVFHNGRYTARIFSLIFSLFILLMLLGCGLGPAASQQASNPGASTSTSAAPAARAHSVQLRWAPSNSNHVLGYHVYRRGKSEKHYVRLNPALLANPDYLDTTVKSGQTYYYVVTASSALAESTTSLEAKAVIPTP